jgi:hypothetical protein
MTLGQLLALGLYMQLVFTSDAAMDPFMRCLA